MDTLELFLAAQDHAKEQLEESATDREEAYWQGVKDGLRKCYAIMTNDPTWAGMGAGSPNWRPGEMADV